jgi:HD superfamily phosphohydrolase
VEIILNMKAHTQDSIRVNDALHDFIFLDRLAWDFIDTPHFQRLRKLKQLPSLEYVYPCATHTRFEHAIGTAHLAKKFLTILIKNNPAAYTDRKASENRTAMSREEVIESAVRTVTIAALLREVGHGPYSESFELVMA